jgi:hypothetical protein
VGESRERRSKIDGGSSVAIIVAPKSRSLASACAALETGKSFDPAPLEIFYKLSCH